MRVEEKEASVARVLFGREGDVAALADLIGTHRLVSIVGAGGVGKTALGIAVSHQLRDAFGGEVVKVELVPLTDGKELMPTLVTALGLAVGSAKARDAVAKALSACPPNSRVGTQRVRVSPTSLSLASMKSAASPSFGLASQRRIASPSGPFSCFCRPSK